MHHIPVHDLWWLAASGAGARYVRHKVRHYRNVLRHSRKPDATRRLLWLQSLYGYNPHSLASIRPGTTTFSVPNINGAIVYEEFGRVWLAAGDPLAHPDDVSQLVRAFLNSASKVNRICAFVPATEKFAGEAVNLGLSAVKIGASPYFDLREWNPKGNVAKSLRAGVNQAIRAGVQVTLIDHLDDNLREEATALCFEWLRARRSATTFGWLLSLDPFLHSERKKLFAARTSQNQLVGIIAASPMPGRNAWYLEDVLRRFDAPRGTADLLVVESLKHLKSEGAMLATLGTSPLVTDGVDNIISKGHPMVERALRIMAHRFNSFYNFKGLRRFKGKFVPTFWESEYVLVQRGPFVPTQVASAIVRAIVPGGVKEIVVRKALRSLKG